MRNRKQPPALPNGMEKPVSHRVKPAVTCFLQALNRWSVPALLVAAPAIAIAEQLNLATTPLFLTTSAKPNVVFLADDALSMDFGLATPENQGKITLGTCGGTVYDYYYTFRGSSTGGATAPAANANTGQVYIIATEAALIARGVSSPYGGVWRARNKDYNKIYYNPDVTYTPWEGADSTGANYSNVDYLNAPYNPYRPSDGTVDLTSSTSMTYTTDYCPPSGGTALTSVNVSSFYPAHYYVWTDDYGGANGVVDADDTHTLVEIRATAALCSENSNTQPCLKRNYTGEIQNFANWFSYYRKRDLTAKNAISKFVGVAANSQYRVAHATITGNDSASNASILALNTSTTTGNTRTLLNAVYSSRPAGTTKALRSQFNKVGRYFECLSSNIFGSDCPIQSAADGGACQQNFAILVTDGAWTDSSISNSVGDADGDGSSSYDGGSYAGTGSDTLGDIAMHYYERDLSATLSNLVPVMAGIDDNTQQHMVTYAVALAASDTLGANPDSTDTGTDFWPAVASSSSDNIKVSDLRHAAYNGRGQFLNAEAAHTLASALSTAQNAISDRTGSSAAVAVNSRSLSTSTRLYQARFISGEWSGDLRALSIAENGSVDSVVWSAKDQLKSQHWSTGRAVLTANTASRGIPFRWTTSGTDALTAAQMSYLNTKPTDGTNDGRGEARLEWLRGNTSNEGSGTNDFRQRTNGFKLGDIVDSTPIFVGAPPYLGDYETTVHTTFRSVYSGRTEMIYVGANDGMLHGFDASTGQEKIAYVPSPVYENLSRLTAANYSTNHRYFVNGSPTVGDVFTTFTYNCSSSACWRTVLVSGLGTGGKGVFALDVTDPDGDRPATANGLPSTSGLAFSENNADNIVLWEFTDSSTPNDMGYILGQPTIAKLHNNKWGVIFGNGYNSTNEKAVLYILDVKDGSIIKKIDLSDGVTDQGNGLSAPAVVDTNGDFIADYVYVGDLRGNLWKVDITSSNTNSWESDYESGSTPYPMFVAMDASSNRQPITVKPEVGNQPTGEGGYMVYFGTGRYLDEADNNAANTSSPVNTFYGIWDKPYTGSGTPVTRAKLLAQTISTFTGTFGSTSATVRTVSNTTIQNWATSGSCNADGSGNCLGCRLDLRTAYSDSLGERSVSNPVLLGGTLPRILFTTLIPQSDACSYGGTSWLMEISPTNCGRLSQSVFDVSGDGTIDNEDKTSGGDVVSGINPGIGIMPEPVVLRDPANGQDLKAETGSTGAVTTIKNYVSGSTGGRQSWRQLK